MFNSGATIAVFKEPVEFLPFVVIRGGGERNGGRGDLGAGEAANLGATLSLTGGGSLADSAFYLNREISSCGAMVLSMI